jgi:hypothetical protein
MIEMNMAVAVMLILAFLGCVAGFGKLLLHLYDVRAGERHNQLAQALQREAERLQELQRRVDAINHTLPLEYVRREDWIRFSASIDAKLDRLAELIHQRIRGTQ